MRSWMRALICLALAATFNLGCTAESPRNDLNIDPRADEALRRMSDTLAKAQSFRMHNTATVEEQLESGQLVHFSRDSVVVVNRPYQLRADVRRGPDQYRIWYQGKELTFLDISRNRYAVVRTPDRIDKMLDFLAEEHGIVIPLADLLFPDPYEVLTEKVTSGAYVGQEKLDGRTCDHLLFTQDNVDWQIWIDVDEPAVPRKLVITYKEDADQPQYEAVLDDWQFGLPTDLAVFVPQVPKSAVRVSLDEFADHEEGEAE